MAKFFATIFFVALVYSGNAQFGYGFTASNDLYHYYQNPSDDTGESTSAGSALLNVGFGPKLWFGGDDMSFSVEAQGTFGVTGLSLGDYKGLGTAAVPVMAKLNFGGLSGLDKEGKFGFSIGAGMQWSRTELYYLDNSFEDKGGVRETFRTIIGQVGYGFGMTGFTIHAFARYGYDPDSSAKTFNLGIQYDFNLPKLKEITNPESDL